MQTRPPNLITGWETGRPRSANSCFPSTTPTKHTPLHVYSPPLSPCFRRTQSCPGRRRFRRPNFWALFVSSSRTTSLFRCSTGVGRELCDRRERRNRGWSEYRWNGWSCSNVSTQPFRSLRPFCIGKCPVVVVDRHFFASYPWVHSGCSSSIYSQKDDVHNYMKRCFCRAF